MKPVLDRCLTELKKRWGTLFHKQVINVVAYGSGVVPQTANFQNMKTNTIDLLIEVKNAPLFHQQLTYVSRNDYAGLAWLLGPPLLHFSTQSIFPMHSNHVQLAGRRVKYSVVGKQDLRTDLSNWNRLSFAGRLHKVVVPLQPYQEGFEEMLYLNRKAALAVALLLLKPSQQTHLTELLENVCEISYAGDIRFSARAENPNKIRNIVLNSYTQLVDIYYPILQSLSQEIKSLQPLDKDTFAFKLTPPSLAKLLSLLPKSLLQSLQKKYEEGDLVRNILLNGTGEAKRELTGIIVSKNRWSSLRMASENLVTASPLKNLDYLLAKLSKGREK